MPKEGYATITVDDEFYSNLSKHFQKNAKLLKRVGMGSMSAFYSGLLETLLRHDDLYNKTIDCWSKDIANGMVELKLTRRNTTSGGNKK